MSTKTTFKRIALVTVAALGLGVIAVAPSSAATSGANWATTGDRPFVVTVADTVSGDQVYDAPNYVWDSGTSSATVAVSQVAGASNFVELYAAGSDTTTAAGTISVQVAVTGTTLAVAAQPSSGTDTFTVNSGATIATSAVRSATTATITGARIRVAVTAAGTYTAVVSKIVTVGGISTVTTQQTFTITGTAAATRGVIVLGNSSSYITDSATARADLAAIKAAELSADSTVLAAKGTSRVAGIRVTLKDGQATPVGIADKELVAVVTGAGLVSAIGGSTGARVATATTDSVGVAGFAVYGDGTAGTGKITITQGTTVVAEESYTFTGAVAKLEAKNLKSVLSTTSAADLATAVEVKATDSAGNLVTGAAAGFTATSSDAAVLSSTITVAEGTAAQLAAGLSNGPGYYYISVKSGSGATIASGSKATLTVKYTLADATTVTAPAVSFTSGGAVIYSVALTSSSSSALAGDKVTLTLTAKDKAGNPIADGTYVVFDTTTVTQNAGALTSSQTLTNTLYGTGAVTFVGGVKTATFYAPLNKVVLTGTLGSDAAIAAAIQATTVTTTVEVSNSSLEAANAATTAALAANDAVDALAATVAKLVAGLKAQITALTKLIVKIQKKVRA